MNYIQMTQYPEQCNPRKQTIICYFMQCAMLVKKGAFAKKSKSFNFWAAAPKGMKSCRTQGGLSFVCSFVSSFVRPSVRPPSQAQNQPSQAQNQSSQAQNQPFQLQNQLSNTLNQPCQAQNQACQPFNVPSKDVWKFTPVSYRTSALWGRCPALTILLQLITPSRASGTADHVRSLDECFFCHDN